jgi:hypothetical protein
MSSNKRRPAPGPLSDSPVLRPEWQARIDDARAYEIEKTRLLRQARLAAQAKPAKPAVALRPASTAAKAPKKDVRARRAS